MFELLGIHSIFLIAIVLIWLIGAVIQDVKKLEVANWWNFSFIAVVLSYRAFLSVAESNIWYFIWGLIGLAGGFALANAFYYARLFAGGDAKLMLGLGAALPLSLDSTINLKILLVFLIAFLFMGGIYGMIYSLVLMSKYFNKFKPEFFQQFKKYKIISLVIFTISIIWIVFSLAFNIWLIIWLSLLLFLSPILLIYAKAVEESCMIKNTEVKNLAVGDWIVKPIKIRRGKLVKPNWEGLTEEELKLFQKNLAGKKIPVKYGIPFTPTFLLAFIVLIILMNYNFGLNILNLFF